MAWRKLLKVKTNGSYVYSRHDLSWVQFMRLPGFKDMKTYDNVCHAYWKGDVVHGKELTHFGKPWTEKPIFEILLSGRVDFIK